MRMDSGFRVAFVYRKNMIVYLRNSKVLISGETPCSKKMSDNVNVTVEFEDGARMSMKGYTVDGKWKPDTAVKCKVIAWRTLPKPYQPEGEKP